MSQPTIRQSARQANEQRDEQQRMDAPLRLATSEGERWAYVADVLQKTAEQNKETAEILARLCARLDDHDGRIELLEERQDRVRERMLDHAEAGQHQQHQQQQSQSSEGDATPGPSSSRWPSLGFAALVNRVYSDWRMVGLIVLAAYSVWSTFVGPHVGIVLR